MNQIVLAAFLVWASIVLVLAAELWLLAVVVRYLLGADITAVTGWLTVVLALLSAAVVEAAVRKIRNEQ